MRLHQLEPESQRGMHALIGSTGAAGTSPSSTSSPGIAFDISKHGALVPTFSEAKEDSYFGAFERIASALQWPTDVWPLLLQCTIYGMNFVRRVQE